MPKSPYFKNVINLFLLRKDEKIGDYLLQCCSRAAAVSKDADGDKPSQKPATTI